MTPLKRGDTYYAVYVCTPGYCVSHTSSARHWASLRTKDKREAQRLCNDLEKRLNKERARIALGLPILRTSDMTLGLFMDTYLESTVHDKAPTTRRTEHSCLMSLIRILGADCPLERLTQEQMEYYKKTRLKDIAPRSWNSELGTLRAIFAWGLRRNPPLFSINPFTLITRVDKGAPTIDKYVSPEDVRRVVLGCKDEIVRDMIVFMYATFCRGSELRDLTWQDIDFERGTIVFPYPKERRKKTIAILPVVRRVLDNAAHRRTNDLVFPGPKGEKMKASLLHYYVREAGRTVGVKLSPHRLRHGIITRSLDEGIPPHIVQKQAGHSNITTTMMYTHVTHESQTEAIARLEFDDLGEKEAV